MAAQLYIGLGRGPKRCSQTQSRGNHPCNPAQPNPPPWNQTALMHRHAAVHPSRCVCVCVCVCGCVCMSQPTHRGNTICSRWFMPTQYPPHVQNINMCASVQVHVKSLFWVCSSFQHNLDQATPEHVYFCTCSFVIYLFLVHQETWWIIVCFWVCIIFCSRLKSRRWFMRFVLAEIKAKCLKVKTKSSVYIQSGFSLVVSFNDSNKIIKCGLKVLCKFLSE